MIAYFFFFFLGLVFGDLLGLKGFSLLGSIWKFLKGLEAKALAKVEAKRPISMGPPVVLSPMPGATGPGPTGLGPGQVPGPFGHPIP